MRERRSMYVVMRVRPYEGLLSGILQLHLIFPTSTYALRLPCHSRSIYDISSPMSFQFIDNNSINGASRKQIRSHVMRGKNRRPKASKDVVQVKKREILPNIVTRKSDSPESDEKAGSISIMTPLGDTLSYFTFPHELTPRMKWIIQYCRDRRPQVCYSNILTSTVMKSQMNSIYPPEFCFSMDPLRSAWFRYLQSSESFFHNTLAVSQMAIDTLEGRGETSYESLVYLARTYRAMNKELQNMKTPPDPVVAVVASLLFHENVIYQFSTPKTHLDALERMIAMRGGLGSFGPESRVIRQKICRGDIDFSIHDGSVPKFWCDQFPYGSIPELPDLDQFLSNSLGITELQLQDIHQDNMRLCNYLNDSETLTKLNPTTFEDALISLAYRLLYLHPLKGERPRSLIDNAYHLGSVTVLWTVLFASGKHHRSPYTLLAEKISDAANELVAAGMDGDPLLLWLLFVGGISVISPGKKSWHYPQINRCKSALCLDDWQSARDVLRKLPWISLLHDKPAEELWNAAAST